MKAWTKVVLKKEMNNGGEEERARQAPGSWMGNASEGSLLGGCAVVISSPWASSYLRDEVSNRGLPSTQTIWETG